MRNLTIAKLGYYLYAKIKNNQKLNIILCDTDCDSDRIHLLTLKSDR
jgi:hypothetical protein